MNDPSAPKGAKEDVRTRESHAYCNLKICAANLMLLAPLFRFCTYEILDISYGQVDRALVLLCIIHSRNIEYSAVIDT